jgi:hypothetical protein
MSVVETGVEGGTLDVVVVSGPEAGSEQPIRPATTTPTITECRMLETVDISGG